MKPENAASWLRLPSRRLVLLTAAVATVASVASVASRPATLSVNGEVVAADVPPVTVASTAFVPVRTVADRLGAETSYDPRTGFLEIIRGDDTLRLRVNDKHATFNGNVMTLTHAPFIVRGRTMVSINSLSRTFGSKVSYDPNRRSISVNSEGIVEAGAQEVPK
jgi:N-acetylmuramoyl-L-alanine amidase